MPNLNNSIVNYGDYEFETEMHQNHNDFTDIGYYDSADDDFEMEIHQDDIDLTNIDYYESDDDYEVCNKYMESTPMKTNGNNKFKFDDGNNYDLEMEDSIIFEFTEKSSYEEDKFINGVNVSQLSINASLSRLAATYPMQSRSQPLSLAGGSSSNQY